MLCVCIQDCQMRMPNLKHPKVFHKNDVYDFDKCPPNWMVLDTENVDFHVATMDMLLESEWEKEDIIKHAANFYRLKLDKRMSKYNLVTKFVEGRDRHVSNRVLKYDNTGE